MATIPPKKGGVPGWLPLSLGGLVLLIIAVASMNYRESSGGQVPVTWTQAYDRTFDVHSAMLGAGLRADQPSFDRAKSQLRSACQDLTVSGIRAPSETERSDKMPGARASCEDAGVRLPLP